MSPSPRLIGIALALCACACFAPWAPRAATLAALAALVAAAAASLDIYLWYWRGPHLRASVVGEEGATLDILRLTAGRPAPLRLAIAWERAPRPGAQVVLALMPANSAFAAAIQLPESSVTLRSSAPPRELWTGEVTGRERGRFHGLRCGFEQPSRFRLWRMRQWQDLDCSFLVYPDLAPARRALLRSPIYRALAASTLLPLTGQGREFERLRDYQSGDTYADLSWKATARRAFPVTRLFQWEQQQEIYFVLDHSRLSRQTGPDGRLALECFIETALVGATAATEVGDHYGLITFTNEVTHWIGASSGRAHFAACRERLLGLQPTPATPDYDRLFATIKTRLRRRCYLLFLANLTERGIATSFQQAARLVNRTHLLLATSLLPPSAFSEHGPRTTDHAHSPAFSDHRPQTTDHVSYPALAAQLEQRRIEALRPQLALAGIQFQAVPASRYLPTAVEGYLESKRGQRL